MARRNPDRLTTKQWDPLTTAYADLSAPEWINSVPLKFWEDPHNHPRYMKWLGIQLGIEKTEDWYGLNQQILKENHGFGLMSRFDQSQMNCLNLPGLRLHHRAASATR